ncbi:MAG: benzoate-CoA ligase family protein [Candidatus Eremiobacteraeota bacterium]|nr:benzoate-CoA ligase family protein [Candidatus Eremiobacteraeota bacterium]
MIAPEQFNLASWLLDDRISEGRGERIALICGDRSYTYREVQHRANQAAQRFVEAGLQMEQRLLLSLPDGIDYVAALFGALKVGAAVVMVNPGLSDDEIIDLLEFSRATVAVLDLEDIPYGAHLKAHITPQELQSPSGEFTNRPTHRDDIALWLFSGGTTGRPKAVLQSHQSFYNTTVLYGQNFLKMTENDRTLSVPKLFFGYATGSNLFFPFSVGGTAILFPEKSTAEALLDQIERHRPTILINVPTLVNQMVSAGAGRDLSSLRLATSAGEALPEALYWKWKETFGVELLDGLGTAEQWHVFLSNQVGEVRPGSLGRPVPGFEVRICDDEGNSVQTGEIGRLWAGGHARALCYWQLPETSQEALKGRFFASSDLMRQDEDGYFYFCGRADELLKVSGRWLAPAEVESCLLTHPGVRECAVVGQLSADGLTRPYAFVIPTQEVTEQELKDHVLQHLEPYKHPRGVTFVESLPRTHLGKVDRSALRRQL